MRISASHRNNSHEACRTAMQGLRFATIDLQLLFSVATGLRHPDNYSLRPRYAIDRHCRCYAFEAHGYPGICNSFPRQILVAGSGTALGVVLALRCSNPCPTVDMKPGCGTLMISALLLKSTAMQQAYILMSFVTGTG